MIGEEIGKMHLADIIHGDLTTSNMMVRLLFDPASPPPLPTPIPTPIALKKNSKIPPPKAAPKPPPRFEVVRFFLQLFFLEQLNLTISLLFR